MKRIIVVVPPDTEVLYVNSPHTTGLFAIDADQLEARTQGPLMTPPAWAGLVVNKAERFAATTGGAL